MKQHLVDVLKLEFTYLCHSLHPNLAARGALTHFASTGLVDLRNKVCAQYMFSQAWGVIARHA